MWLKTAPTKLGVELQRVLNGLATYLKKAKAEDTPRTLLAIGMVTYLKNIVFNWQYPAIVWFDVKIFFVLLGGFITVTAVFEVRKDQREKWEIKRAGLKLDMQKTMADIVIELRRAGVTVEWTPSMS